MATSRTGKSAAKTGTGAAPPATAAGSATRKRRTTAAAGSAKARQPRAAARAAQAPAQEDALQRYRKMRDFGTTAEPSGAPVQAGVRKSARNAPQALSFVVQKHAARRLHYDFRLELDGTLKSWAIPKGPSLDPADKRMSVHVEDHPLEYATFEGVIPEKQYGAGTVIVWDRGVWIPEGDPHQGYRDGKLKFRLEGEKLQGGFTLVRMKGRGDERQEPWLLIKERDEAARPASEFDITAALPDSVLATSSDPAASEGGKTKTKTKARGAGKDEQKPADATAGKTRARNRKADDTPVPEGARPAALPLTLAPQLATLVQGPPARPEDWLYEVKFDGYRLLARIEGDDVRLFTRNGHDWTAKLKTLARAIAAMKLPSAWLDGEIVVIGKDGTTDFQALQNAFDNSRTESIDFFVFDLPFHDGYDLRKVALAERRAVLRRLFETHNVSAHVRFSESFEAGPEEILTAACRMRLEGLIGKRVDAPYVSGRSNSWIKLKCSERQEFVIGGFTEPAGTRTGLGALLLGIHDEAGRLVYAGKVGTGFDTDMLQALRERLEALRTDQSPFERMPAGTRVKGIWVRPRTIAEVSFGSWTREGLIRHAVFHGLRADKSPTSIGREKAVPPPQTLDEDNREDNHEDNDQRKRAAKPAARSKGKAGGTASRTASGVRISHADRVIDPSTGATKGDLVHYYEAVAERMFVELQGRPLAVVRGPSGVGGELFFQKHAETMNIAGIRRLDPSLWPGHPPMIEVATPQGIVAAAQLNVIEFHTWNADKRTIEKPDRIVFDLDPGEGVPWQHVVEAAALVRGFLEELGLVGFLKTSGGKGLHVVVPIAKRLEWDPVKSFAQAVVEQIARTIPQRFVAKSGPRNRVGRIFIDYLRNGRGATTAAAFSARARPGLGVSIPVRWEELPTLTSGAHWTIANGAERVAEMAGNDPWADYAATRQPLGKAIRLLQGD
ncbi:DNA ligase D [Cupriavidus sp. AU9028]|uniref:DNA ligase D n=1 Tax=Cupriavidus sp. AU9028 TaxID=2871157 RepID=UPI001C96AF6F|nr:DNA ligase D [Cupriavidus sp. AU9028]MBY4898401.1 DNA ligase D [Cupriavidus sp. AU9028]